MTDLQTICDFLESFAPARLAEEWDNVGLLVGDRAATVERVMTCLTVTPDSAAEAVQRRADLIVAHHPLPFRPLKRLTADLTPGRLLLQLIRSGVAVYSPHTAFDSAAAGINERLAAGLGLTEIVPLAPLPDDPDALGAGRRGKLAAPLSVADLAARVKEFLYVDGVQVVGESAAPVQSPAVACGSAGSFLEAARRAGCDALVTGETTFHTCLEAAATGIALILPGHYASERFAVESLAEVLSAQFTDLEIWASQRERDPLKWM